MTTTGENRNDRIHEMPAGTYFIGDPCYVIRDDWKGYLEAWNNGETWKGQSIAAFSADGDGGFTDNFGREYPVDSGMLAAVPAEHITAVERFPWDGHTVIFAAHFRCSMDGKDRIAFGDIVIRTRN